MRHHRTAGFRAVGSLFSASVSLLAGSELASATVQIPPSRDAYVLAQLPNNNYGTLPSLKSGGTPERRSYLRFAIPPLADPAATASLQLWTVGGLNSGIELRSAPGTWSEVGLTFENAPPPGSDVIASTGPAGANRWVELDATALAGPLLDAGGDLSVALTADAASTTHTVASREADPSLAPVLMVETNTPVAPTKVRAPAISGEAQSGQTLSADSGEWTGTVPITYIFEWARCSADNTVCKRVAGATSTTYQLGPADVGSRLRVLVTARNSAGATLLSSRGTSVVSPPPGTGDPVIAAAGDVACEPTNTTNACQAGATSDLLQDGSLAGVLALGDLQYECGGYADFLQSFDISWGRSKSLMRPVPGNHEYLAGAANGPNCGQYANASGYFDYFNGVDIVSGQAGTRPFGWYSYNLGSWHMIALNTTCGRVGGCGQGSAQEKWLAADLIANASRCTLAYWHHPRFSSGGHGNTTALDPFWRDLYAAGVDVVLSGHDHDYERFAPQSPAGVADPVGIRQFVVGTGGRNLTGFKSVQSNSELRESRTFGVLDMTLHDGSYDWQFLPVGGGPAIDAGSDSCH
jgi:acid phosphatase type 7